jgi:hypothetical protein
MLKVTTMRRSSMTTIWKRKLRMAPGGHEENLPGQALQTLMRMAGDTLTIRMMMSTG